jgi:outer membrane protein TolC
LSLSLGVAVPTLAHGQSAALRTDSGTKSQSARSGKGVSRRSESVRQVSGEEPQPAPAAADQPLYDPVAGDIPAQLQTELADQRSISIDLGAALRLAGVENPEVVLSRQRVEAVVAQQQFAAAQVLPTLNLGSNYDKHTGLLQQSSGNILNVDRSALYVGAGANAVAAGTVSIPGLYYNLNLSDSIYDYFVLRQRAEQSRHESRAVENQVLLEVALAYTDLLGAEGRLSVAILNRNDAREVARLTDVYAKTGEGRQADADRAATELSRREEDLVEARVEVGNASRRLSELLNLDATIRLRPLESRVVPQPVVPSRIPLAELLAIALVDRPEMQARQSAIRAALLELDSAKMLPFSPQTIFGFSGGLFGGGSNLVHSSTPPAVGLPPNQPFFGDFKGRTDIDAILYWSARNMGLGNKALIDSARARAQSADFEQRETLDRVRFEVADAYVKTHATFAEIQVRARGIRSGMAGFVEDMVRVRGREARPIELLDSFRHLATERGDYLDRIVAYNRAEFELYVALGRPPADLLARPVPLDPSQPPPPDARETQSPQ